jgi:hypothetical protein
LREPECEALHDPVHRERHHDRGNRQVGDAEAVHGTDREPEPEREEHCGHGSSAVAEREDREQNPGRVQDPRDGEVDSADEDHEGLAGGDEADERRDLQDCVHAPPARETGVEERSDDEHDDRERKRNERAPAIGSEVPLDPADGCELAHVRLRRR